MIERFSILHLITSKNTPIVILNGLPGSGKSTILDQLSNYTTCDFHNNFPDPDKSEFGVYLLWDPVIRSFCQHIEKILQLCPKLESKKQTLVISANWFDHNKIISEALLYKKISLIEQHSLLLDEHEISQLHPEIYSDVYLQTKGWPVLVSNWNDLHTERYKESLKEFIRARILPSMSYHAQRLLIALALNIKINKEIMFIEEIQFENISPLIALNNDEYILGIPYIKNILVDIAKSDPRIHQESMRIVAKHHFKNKQIFMAIKVAVTTQNIDLAIKWFKESGSGMYGYYHGFSELEQLLKIFPAEVINSELTLCWAKTIYLFKNQKFLEAKGFIESLHLQDRSTIRHDNEQGIASLITASSHTYFALLNSDINLGKLQRLENKLASNENAMMNYYSKMSIQYNNIGNWFQAAVFQHKELELALKHDVYYLIFYCHFNLARINLRMGYVKVAIEHNQKAKDYIKRIRFYHTLSFEHNFIDLIDGIIALMKGDTSDSLMYWNKVTILRKHSEVWPELIVQFDFFGVATLLINNQHQQANSLLDELHYEYQIRFSDNDSTFYFQLLSILILQQQERWVVASAKLANITKDNQPITGMLKELYHWLLFRNEVGLICIHKGKNKTNLKINKASQTAWVDICYSLQEIKLLWFNNSVNEMQDKLLSLLYRALKLNLWLPLMLEMPLLNIILKKIKVGEKKRIQYTKFEQAISKWEEKCQQNNKQITEHELTNKQLLIIQRLAEGLSNKQIAQYTGLSESTIKFHLKNIFKKFSLTSRQKLIQLANEKKWIK